MQKISQKFKVTVYNLKMKINLSVLPIIYLIFILIIPIASLFSTSSVKNFWSLATEPIALSAYNVTFSMAFLASLINGVFGFLLAWVLVRYDFPGRKLLDAAIDLPFALPTSVAGLTLVTIYSPKGWIGQLIFDNTGIKLVQTRVGIALAMIFVSFPFVVRNLQPVLQEMDQELEEIAWSLGANSWETFRRIILPQVIPTWIGGVTLAFSRAVGEYGSVVVMASNIPLKDLIASVLVFQKLEQYEKVGATVIGTVVLLISLIILFTVQIIQNILSAKTKP